MMENLTTAFQNSLKTSYKTYKVSDLTNICKWILETCDSTNLNKVNYIECPVAFDIESSSFHADGNKAATMYIWVLGLLGKCVIGRTWEEFVQAIDIISLELRLSDERRLLIYVHNLDFDFQFFRKWLNWTKIFALEERKPVYAISDLGIEFRCSYKLSGYKLETIGQNLKTFSVKKLTGYLDYNTLRHSSTPLTDEELEYVKNDALVLNAYILECMMEEGTITKIPLTKTGYVRRYIREKCFEENKKEYQSFIRNLRISPDEYLQLKRAFQGGYTHASPFYAGKTVENGESRDFISSYPAVMVAEKFPMSCAELVHITSMRQFEMNLKNYSCLFDVEFFDIESTFIFDNYISASRCFRLEGDVQSNGRIVRAKHLITTITEQDYMIIRKTYRWKGNPRIGAFRRYKKDYLPTPFVKAILDIYEKKTTLKDIPEFKEIYERVKELLNSTYGMCVTDPVRADIPYINNQWESEYKINETLTKIPNIEFLRNKIKSYNNSWNRTLFWPWGVWVTAYARRNLWTAILEMKEDHLYCDTDSEKFKNCEKHTEYFNRYNQFIINALNEACKHHGIDPERTRPKNKKGLAKQLGIWDFDGHYTRFKALRAKCYMMEYSPDERNGKNASKTSITVSGVNKQVAVPWLKETYRESIFQAFSESLYIPSSYTGKLTHTYIDTPISCTLTDYLGIPCTIYEKSCVNLEGASYNFSTAHKFLEYAQNLRANYM